MFISNISFKNNQPSFKGGLSSETAKLIIKTKPKKIEKELANSYIMADFGDNKLVAFLSKKTIEIFGFLRKQLPSQIEACSFGESVKSVAECFVTSGKTRTGKPIRAFGVEFNLSKMNKTPEEWNAFCDGADRQKLLGSSHILTPFVHEFVHADLFKNLRYLKSQDVFEKVKFAEEIPMGKFEAEIKEKIADYATTDPIELHAVYWAKEICSALDDKLKLKYNPFEQPKVKLSEGLRKFVNAIGEGEFEKANEIARG